MDSEKPQCLMKKAPALDGPRGQLAPYMHPGQDDKGYDFAKYFILLARLAGFEPATHGLEVRCSVH